MEEEIEQEENQTENVRVEISWLWETLAEPWK